MFDHGGDPNIRHTGPLGFSQTPLFAVITRGGGDKAAKVRRLIELGADMNVLSNGKTPVMQAVSWFGQCELALVMLDSGADFKKYDESGIQRLIHIVVDQERRLGQLAPEQRARFHDLVKWLEDHGESYEKAKEDIARWDSWGRTTGEFRQRMDAEIAERKAREKAAAERKPE